MRLVLSCGEGFVKKIFATLFVLSLVLFGLLRLSKELGESDQREYQKQLEQLSTLEKDDIVFLNDGASLFVEAYVAPDQAYLLVQFDGHMRVVPFRRSSWEHMDTLIFRKTHPDYEKVFALLQKMR